MSEQRKPIFFCLNILFFKISISYCKPLFCWHSICCVFGVWYFKISISRRSVKYYVGTIMPFCFFLIYTCLDQKTRNLRFSQASGANVPISHCCVLLNIGFPSYFNTLFVQINYLYIKISSRMSGHGKMINQFRFWSHFSFGILLNGFHIYLTQFRQMSFKFVPQTFGRAFVQSISFLPFDVIKYAVKFVSVSW